MLSQSSAPQQRRAFFTRINAGAISLAALAMGGVAPAQNKSISAPRWEPARHEKDDWLDQVPGKHRLVFDTTNHDSVADALLFANNFVRVNRSDYGLQNNELAVVIVVRHRSTPFGYSDAMWAKYGTELAARAQFEDPKTKLAQKSNVFNSGNAADSATNRAPTLDALSKLGIQLAVCSTSTRGYAGAIAEATGGSVDTIFNELTSNLVIPTSRMVPAGIVAVARAQERGYSLVST